jgi:Flp pilus assembly pilin Flp
MPVAASIGGRWDAVRRRSDRGAGFVEYGLLLVLITAACVLSIRVLGISVSDRFTSASTAITGAP